MKHNYELDRIVCSSLPENFVAFSDWQFSSLYWLTIEPPFSTVLLCWGKENQIQFTFWTDILFDLFDWQHNFPSCLTTHYCVWLTTQKLMRHQVVSLSGMSGWSDTSFWIYHQNCFTSSCTMIYLANHLKSKVCAMTYFQIHIFYMH